MWHFLKLVVGSFLRVLRFPPLLCFVVPEARCLPLSESEESEVVMWYLSARYATEAIWKLDGSGFRLKKKKTTTTTTNKQSKTKQNKTKQNKTKQNKQTNKQTNTKTKKLNSRDNDLCVIITLSPNKTKKNPHGKAKWKKTTTTTKNGGVKMLMTKRHIRKRSSDQHLLLLLSEVKTKEYRHSECTENIKCTEISK